MSPARLLFRDSMLFLVFKIFLFFFVVGIGVFAYWTKALGGIFVAIAVLLAITIWRYLSLRKIEFKNAVLNPGVVIARKPPTVLILANIACGGQKAAKEPIWAVEAVECRSLEPLPAEIGTRIPCVTAFLGSGFSGSWERMVSTPLTSGTGSRKLLEEALLRLSSENEWRILNDAVERKKVPMIGKTLRI